MMTRQEGVYCANQFLKMERKMSNVPCAPMPQYQSHKKVWALKIKALEPIEGMGGKLAGMMMYVEEPGFAPIALDGGYMTKHQPKVGGYYVVYPDGYKSWSPAEAFEDGYTRI